MSATAFERMRRQEEERRAREAAQPSAQEQEGKEPEASPAKKAESKK